MAVMQYHGAHKQYPDKLSRLYPDAMDELSVFICAASYDDIRRHGNVEEIKESIDSNASYVYFPPNEHTRQDDIILADRSLSNHGNGIFVTRYDGHTDWVDEKHKEPSNVEAKVGLGLVIAGLLGFFVGKRWYLRNKNQKAA